MINLKTTLVIFFAIISVNASSQIIATIQLKEPIEGICDNEKIYALYSGFTGQEVPKCSISLEEMQKILNEKLQFLKDNPSYKGNGKVSVFINCEGEPLNWSISISPINETLDKELLEIFGQFTNWTAGRLNNETVDSYKLISLEIKKGKLKLN